MRISDWISDVCSSELARCRPASETRDGAQRTNHPIGQRSGEPLSANYRANHRPTGRGTGSLGSALGHRHGIDWHAVQCRQRSPIQRNQRSEEHTSELQSLMRISYAVFCLKKKTTYTHQYNHSNLSKPNY